MKKLFLLLLFCFPAALFSQDIDTIFYTDGSWRLCTLFSSTKSRVDYFFHKDGVQSSGSIKRKYISRYAFGEVIPLSFTDTIPVTGRNVNEIYDNIKNWFVNPSQQLKKAINFESKTSGIIQANFIMPFYDGFSSMKDIKANGFISFNVSIQLTPDKFIYLVNDFRHSGAERAPGGPISFNVITNKVLSKNVSNDSFLWLNAKWNLIKSNVYATSTTICNELLAIILRFPIEKK